MSITRAMNVTCVRCTSVLDTTRIADVEVDLCPSCGGLWLDHGEIERLGQGNASELDRLRAQLAGTAGAESPSETQTACPVCPAQLKELTLGPIRIDYCERCHGVFLDKGELDQALAAVQGASLRDLLRLAGSVPA
jgi:hypothetical protein